MPDEIDFSEFSNLTKKEAINKPQDNKAPANVSINEEYDIYRLLGVTKESTEQQIDFSYKQIMKIYNPVYHSFTLKKSKDMKEIKDLSQRIRMAYVVLKNKELKSKYDRMREASYQSKEELKNILENMYNSNKNNFIDKLYLLDENDPYIIFDITPNSSHEEIMDTYREINNKYGSSNYSFSLLSPKEYEDLNRLNKKFNYAFRILSDPVARKRYDDENLKNRKTETNQEDKSEEYLKNGIKAYKEEEYSQAMSLLQKSIEINPKNSESHYYLGLAAEAKGWLDYAKSEYKITLHYKPEHPDAKKRFDKLDKKGFLGKLTAKLKSLLGLS